MSPEEGAKLISPLQSPTAGYWAGLQLFLSHIFRLRVFTFYFWSGLILLAMGVLILCAFLFAGPTVDGVNRCSGKPLALTCGAIWLAIAFFYFLIAFGHAQIESSGEKDFERPTFFIKLMGILVRGTPLLFRTLTVLTVYFLAMLNLQILFLPECNSLPLLVVAAIEGLFAIALLSFGVIAKRHIALPPYLFNPLRGSDGLLNQYRRMMASLGP